MNDFTFSVVAFDLDGTLADTAPDLTSALNHSLRVLGRPAVSEASVRDMVGHGAKALLRKGLAATGVMTEELVEEGFPLFLDYYEAHIADATKPWPGVEKAMDDLATMGVKLAVCTNKMESLSAKLITQLGWDGRFASLVGGDTLAVKKPDPAPLFLAIEQAGGGRAAFIGDSITDTETGINGNIPTIAVTFGFADRPADQLGATALIDHFDQLIPTLVHLGAAKV